MIAIPAGAGVSGSANASSLVRERLRTRMAAVAARTIRPPTIVIGVSVSPSSTQAATELTTGMDCVINEPSHAST